jgi:hypothetical protein
MLTSRSHASTCLAMPAFPLGFLSFFFLFACLLACLLVCVFSPVVQSPPFASPSVRASVGHSFPMLCSVHAYLLSRSLSVWATVHRTHPYTQGRVGRRAAPRSFRCPSTRSPLSLSSAALSNSLFTINPPNCLQIQVSLRTQPPPDCLHMQLHSVTLRSLCLLLSHPHPHLMPFPFSSFFFFFVGRHRRH